MNIVACARLVYCLSKEPSGGMSNEMLAEAKRGLSLIEQLREKFNARSLETKDSDAREWLANSIKEYDPLEQFLKDALGQVKSPNGTTPGRSRARSGTRK
jgi:hypothetical protein